MVQVETSCNQTHILCAMAKRIELILRDADGSGAVDFLISHYGTRA